MKRATGGLLVALLLASIGCQPQHVVIDPVATPQTPVVFHCKYQQRTHNYGCLPD